MALSILGGKKTEGQHIAVLGDMLELGHRAAAEHYRIGRIAAQRADLILAYGKASQRIVTGAVTGGILPRNAMFFDSHEELVKTLVNRAQPGDVILFKGSRSMRMEHALAMFVEQTAGREDEAK